MGMITSLINPITACRITLSQGRDHEKRIDQARDRKRDFRSLGGHGTIVTGCS